MKLRLSDPGYTERLVAFLSELGHAPARAEDGNVEFAGEIPRAELAIYLRVWSVLEPGAAVTVE